MAEATTAAHEYNGNEGCSLHLEAGFRPTLKGRKMNAFNTLVSFISALNLSGADTADILAAVICFRNVTDVAVKAAQAETEMVRDELNERIKNYQTGSAILEQKLREAREYSQNLHNLAVDRAKKIDEMGREITALKAALEEARAKTPKTVKVELGEICRRVVAYDKANISCIKDVRSGNLINDGSCNLPELRLVKEVYDAVAAFEGKGPAVRSQNVPMLMVNTGTSYYSLKGEVITILQKFYPTFNIEVCDE